MISCSSASAEEKKKNIFCCVGYLVNDSDPYSQEMLYSVSVDYIVRTSQTKI